MTAENPMSIDHFKNTAELALDEVMKDKTYAMLLKTKLQSNLWFYPQ